MNPTSNLKMPSAEILSGRYNDVATSLETAIEVVVREGVLFLINTLLFSFPVK